MNKRIQTIFMILAVFSLLLGCQRSSSTEEFPDRIEQPPGHEDGLKPSEDASLNDPLSEPVPNPEDEADDPQPESEPIEEPASVEVTHYMTNAYILKPIAEEGARKVVLLTFDDAPKQAEQIDALLDTLDKHQAKAIFFVNGYLVEQKPELLQKIHERGQAIGNHSWDHIVLSQLTEDEMDQQVIKVQTIVEELTGEPPRFFRPPHGSGNDYLKNKVKELGMLYMNWSNGSRDWEKPYQQPELVIEQVLAQLHPGSNILMHELPWTIEALDRLLSELSELEYEFLNPFAIRLDDQATDSPKS